FDKAKAELGSRAQSDLDVLSYIAFPQQAEQFFEQRELKKAIKATYTIKEVRE
ncbi:MAG TPA: oxaloacetate decarboxylase subunit alpha, partial [Candidatus Flavonifractor merdigallinarum]|nr:oxaloacetate decarboxylase subunit alpha [Candidatus Flavonifractor merdigallinarum]